jgi:hypothetical protein
MGIFSFALSCFAATGQVVLTWTPINSPQVRGYIVEWGTEAGNYPNSKDVGNETSALMTLESGCTYHFAVRGYDTSHVAGERSADVSSQVIPGMKTLIDLNSDGVPDILWRNYATGLNEAWIMDESGHRQGVVNLPAATNLAWQLAAAGDFNEDGKTDLIWRNYATGDNALWTMDGATRTSVVISTQGYDVNWRLCGTGDFNKDGKPDLVWRNTSTGANSIWILNGTTVMEMVSLPASTNLNWRLEAIGDFNCDGKLDLAWRNYSTGVNAVWFMDGFTRTAIGNLPAATNRSWHLEGAADADGDGKPDLYWHNTENGKNAIWLMDGTNRTSTINLPDSDINSRMGDNL